MYPNIPPCALCSAPAPGYIEGIEGVLCTQMAQLLSSRQSASSSSQKALEAALAVAPAMQLPAEAAHRARDELKISTPQV